MGVRHPEFAQATVPWVSYLFEPEALDDLLSGRQKTTQVYRNFLLTETVRENESFADSLSIVLAPRENVSNRGEEEKLKCQIKEKYRYKFQTVNLEAFVQALREKFPKEEIFGRFWERYLNYVI